MRAEISLRKLCTNFIFTVPCIVALY